VISFIAEGMPDYKRTPFSDTIYVVLVVNSDAPEEQAVPASLVAPVVLI
jgi:hypothetical protein